MDTSPRRIVKANKEFVSNVGSSEIPGYYPDEDHSWSLARFEQKCRLQVQRLSQRSVEFDLEGVDAPIANAIRRVLIAEVPTIAIEHIYVWNNTSVIQDEVLSHRLGLVPLNVNPRLLNMREAGETPTDLDTVVFRLNIKCEHNPQAPQNSEDPVVKYINSNVHASDVEWVPQGDQEEMFVDKKPAPTNGNILLAKLRPGQEIELEMHAVKGVGSEHAKWSPVATATYRLMPHIKLLGPIPSHLSEKFSSCFSPGVIEIVKDPTGKSSVKVANPRNDTVSREALRHKEFEDLVELGRIRDFFIFQVESEGAYPPEELVPEAISVLRRKIADVRKAVASLQSDLPDDRMDTQ